MIDPGTRFGAVHPTIADRVRAADLPATSFDGGLVHDPAKNANLLTARWCVLHVL